MTDLELFAIIVLAGAILILFYYYLIDLGLSFDRFRSSENGGSMGVTESVSGLGERIKRTGKEEKETSKKDEGSSMSGMSQRMTDMSKKITGKVKEVPISTDILSNRIEAFLDEQSDQLIKNWDLATKSDLSELEKRFGKINRDIDSLEKRFNEYRGYTNKRIESIDERLKKLENPVEESKE